MTVGKLCNHFVIQFARLESGNDSGPYSGGLRWFNELMLQD